MSNNICLLYLSCQRTNEKIAKVDEIEKKHGWAITGVVGTALKMTYQREIGLTFDVSSFKGLKPNSTIDLCYIAANQEPIAKPATPEKEFFIHCILDHARGLNQSQTRIKDFLGVVSGAWKQANHVAKNVRLLDTTFRTNVTKTSDSSIAICSFVLLRPLKTKVEIVFNLHGKSTPNGVEVTVDPQARVVYGEQFKVDKIIEFLTTRVGTRVVTNEEGDSNAESWVDVVVELQERLLAKGRK